MGAVFMPTHLLVCHPLLDEVLSGLLDFYCHSPGVYFQIVHCTFLSSLLCVSDEHLSAGVDCEHLAAQIEEDILSYLQHFNCGATHSTMSLCLLVFPVTWSQMVSMCEELRSDCSWKTGFQEWLKWLKCWQKILNIDIWWQVSCSRHPLSANSWHLIWFQAISKGARRLSSRCEMGNLYTEELFWRPALKFARLVWSIIGLLHCGFIWQWWVDCGTVEF